MSELPDPHPCKAIEDGSPTQNKEHQSADKRLVLASSNEDESLGGRKRKRPGAKDLSATDLAHRREQNRRYSSKYRSKPHKKIEELENTIRAYKSSIASYKSVLSRTVSDCLSSSQKLGQMRLKLMRKYFSIFEKGYGTDSGLRDLQIRTIESIFESEIKVNGKIRNPNFIKDQWKIQSESFPDMRSRMSRLRFLAEKVFCMCDTLLSFR